jgi:hypothetical protein
MQKASPAKLVASTIYRTLNDKVTNYTYVDFCAGAGGPTPFIEKDLNAQLSMQANTGSTAAESSSSNAESCPTQGTLQTGNGGVQFVLTDIHPHIPDWTNASKKSANLSFISDPVDATNAPADLVRGEGKKVFRLYNLAFHHFGDELGSNILRNTLETADGFG